MIEPLENWMPPPVKGWSPIVDQIEAVKAAFVALEAWPDSRMRLQWLQDARQKLDCALDNFINTGRAE